MIPNCRRVQGRVLLRHPAGRQQRRISKIPIDITQYFGLGCAFQDCSFTPGLLAKRGHEAGGVSCRGTA